MSPALTRVDRFAIRMVDKVVKYRWVAIAVTLVAVFGAASGARHLEFSNNYRAFFSPKNPDLVAFEEFQATYTKNDNFLFVLKPASGSVFSPEVIAEVERLTEAAWQIPYATRVDSITNFQHSRAIEDDLTVDDLIRDGAQLSSEELEERQRIALAEPLLAGRLLSLDAGSTGVNVTLQYPEKSLTEVPEAVAFARDLVADLERRAPDIEVALSGLTMLNNAFAESGQQDAKTLMPAMFLVLIVFMIIALRSFVGTVSTLIVVAFAAVSALGIAGYLGIQLTPISATAPVIIMTLAIADSVHILVSMLGLMREGVDRRRALRESFRINLMPVSITTLTTMIGFLTLNFSDAPPFHDLGNITAIGIAAALVYSVIFLPALISLLPVKVKVQRNDSSGGLLQSRLERLGAWVSGHHRVVLVGSVVFAVSCIALISTVDLNDQWVEYFDERVEFRTDTEMVMDELGGLYQIELSLPAGVSGGISDPDYLQRLEAMAIWLRSQPEVIHVTSYTDIVKRLNKNLHGDDEAWYRLPDDRKLAAQYLLLYELSLPFGLDLNDRIDVDKSSTRVTTTIAGLSTKETRDFLDRWTGWLSDNMPAGLTARPTGATVMFSHISQRNIESMLRGNAIAVLLIAVILSVALRSSKIGALSLIPNAVPILMTFGLWGLLVGKVGMAAATVSASSLGIIVDDTVHFLSKYLRARRERGFDRPAAVRYAFRTVGQAIVITTGILVAGFLVLATSTFRINFELGMLTAIAIVLALLTDFFMLPSLLLWGHDRPEADQDEPFSR